MNSYEAMLYDGTSPVGQAVSLSLTGNGVYLTVLDKSFILDPALNYWESAAIDFLYTETDGTRVDLGLKATDGVRLVIKGEAVQSWLASAIPAVAGPLNGQGWRTDFKLTGLLIGFIGLLGVFILSFERVLPYMLPDSYVQLMVDSSRNTVFTHMGKRCYTAEGHLALQKMLTRVQGGTPLPHKITLDVSASKMVNAFAMPKGHVIIMDGLISRAKSAEEVAGVLAHELGHVAEMHPLRGLSRTLGINMVIAIIGGGTTIDFASHFMMMNYSRSMETEADTIAFGMMREAGLSVAPLAGFFERLAPKAKPEKTESEYKMIEWIEESVELLSSHPIPEKRAAMFREADWKTTEPVLSPSEWKALKSMCSE